MEVLPFDQYIVKVSGSNRLTRRNRRFLRAYVPALEQEESRVPHRQDMEMECELDSAWGARGQSADSNTGPGGALTDVVPGTQDTTSLDGKGDSHDSHGVDLDSSLGGRGLETVQSDTSSQSQNVGLRRSTQASKGKTSQYKDCITGSELDEIGEGT